MADPGFTLTDAVAVIPYLGPVSRLIRAVIVIVKTKQAVEGMEPFFLRIRRKLNEFFKDNIDDIARGNVEGPSGIAGEGKLVINDNAPFGVVVYPMWRRDP